MKVYQPKELTEQERILLKEIFSNPTVLRYLEYLSQEIGNDILGTLPSLTASTEDFHRHLIYEQGKLAVLQTLLSIKEQ